MKRKITAVLAVALVLGLTGCRLEHSSRIKYSQLTGEITTVDAVARVEVPSCNDYKDKTKPSDKLIQTTDLMAKLFPGSEFEGCGMEKMNSLATYTVPMEVGTTSEEKVSNGISIIRNIHGIVYFLVSPQIKNYIVNERKKLSSSELGLHVNIRLNNDTDKDITITPHALFADGKAWAGFWKDTLKISPSKSVNISLSDVSCEYAIQEGGTLIFMEKNE